MPLPDRTEVSHRVYRVLDRVFAPIVHHFFTITGTVLLSVLGFAGYLYFWVYEPPALFPLRTIITIPDGVTVDDAGTILADAHVVRYPIAFALAVRYVARGAPIRAGEYFFDHELNLFAVVDHLVRGEYGLQPLTITVPEGATTHAMAALCAKTLSRFDPITFEILASDKEGYLFPDTYVFLPNATAEQVLDAMERTFYERLRSVEEQVASFGKPLHEVITMASLLEKEAYRSDDRHKIAGILWNRLRVGMPLQVDAVFGYIEKRDTFNPKYSTLAIDSPYNTYKNKGLPPGPIGSPSLDAILAAVEPDTTDALYYLHGRDGVLHLARTFGEHVQNRRRFLD